MKELFVPVEQSIELKELGFEEPCLASWTYKTKEKVPTLYGCGALIIGYIGLFLLGVKQKIWK
jgi:hypothetical protein